MARQTEANKNRTTAIWAAVIAAIATVIAAFIGILRWPEKPAEKPSETRVTGNVIDAVTLAPVANAKIALQASGVPPICYTDSEGVFSFPLRGATRDVRITIDAPGFQPYHRLVEIVGESLDEDLRLKPLPRGKEPPPRPNDHERRPEKEVAAVRPSLASMLNASLRAVGGDDGPWAVTVFGHHQERREEVTSWVRSTLSGSGHDTISLFRKVSDEQRFAADLFRGNSEVFSGLQPGRYCSRVLVGRLSVNTLGSMDGLATAEATLAVHLLSPSGELLKTFELSEKGGGVNDETAHRNAINELKTIIQRDLPQSIE